MTKVTRQRKPTLAAELAALPAAPLAAATEPAAATVAVQPVQVAAVKPVKVDKADKAAKAAKADKPGKPAAPVEAPKAKAKLVRDSFTMPKSEYDLLAQLKHRGTQLQRHVKKSELLRAGIAALNSMSDRNFLAALDRVPSLKTGRPKAEDGAQA